MVGDGVTVPVHIHFKHLDAEHQPCSGAPAFSEAWKGSVGPTYLDNAIERWRRQMRLLGEGQRPARRRRRS